jgi:hypothetical protein
MPSPSVAELTRPIAFPDKIADPVWQERRTFPVAAVYGVPSAFLVVLTFAVRPLALQALFAATTIVALSLLVRGRRRALIETYTVSERFIAIEQRGGGRVAIPTDTLARVRIEGDKVRLEGSAGAITLGFVRRQRALLRALEQVAPTARVEHDLSASCPTCAIRY